jgi:hypothetical protein
MNRIALGQCRRAPNAADRRRQIFHRQRAKREHQPIRAGGALDRTEKQVGAPQRTVDPASRLNEWSLPETARKTIVIAPESGGNPQPVRDRHRLR